MSAREFSSDEPEEDKVDLDFEAKIWLKQIKTKTR
jgi:hypothetical protein